MKNMLSHLKYLENRLRGHWRMLTTNTLCHLTQSAISTAWALHFLWASKQILRVLCRFHLFIFYLAKHCITQVCQSSVQSIYNFGFFRTYNHLRNAVDEIKENAMRIFWKRTLLTILKSRRFVRIHVRGHKRSTFKELMAPFPKFSYILFYFPDKQLMENSSSFMCSVLTQEHGR